MIRDTSDEQLVAALRDLDEPEIPAGLEQRILREVDALQTARDQTAAAPARVRMTQPRRTAAAVAGFAGLGTVFGAYCYRALSQIESGAIEFAMPLALRFLAASVDMVLLGPVALVLVAGIGCYLFGLAGEQAVPE